jgi:catechol 2,3-dioxygenase-like lactoylglutathione lyase family enzyme
MGKVIALDHISMCIPAGGEDRARAFFTGVLGIGEIAKPRDGNRMDGCWFDLGAQQLHMLVDDAFAPEKRAHIALTVADLGSTRTKMVAAGLPIVEFLPSEGRERFFSEDPFGNRIEFLAARSE